MLTYSLNTIFSYFFPMFWPTFFHKKNQLSPQNFWPYLFFKSLSYQKIRQKIFSFLSFLLIFSANIFPFSTQNKPTNLPTYLPFLPSFFALSILWSKKNLPKIKGSLPSFFAFLPSLPNQKKPTYFLSFLAQLFSFF